MGNSKSASSSHNGTLLPDLPPYTTPTTGLLSYVPGSVLPYAVLARIDKPGFIPPWLVHAFGALHAGILMHSPSLEVLKMLAFFLVASEILVSVNFARNDSCDSHYDAKVARIRHRPLVRGALSLPAAVMFDAVLAVIMAAFLIPLPRVCAIYAIPMAAGCFVYPLSKRWTTYPQLILAAVLPCGVFMGSAALGAIPLPYPSTLTTILDLETWTAVQSTYTAAILSNYLASFVWTLLFETIYSFQDAKWDEAAGIGTMTRLLKNQTLAKTFLLMLAITQTALHAHVGTVTPMHSSFWPLSVFATSTTLIVQILCVDLTSEESCMFWFEAGHILTGLSMLSGYVGEYYVQVAA